MLETYAIHYQTDETIPGELVERLEKSEHFNQGFIQTEYLAAGYYVYRWAEVLDADAFQAFKDSGDLFNQELARDFRKYILASNAIYEGMDAYVRFRGQEPDIDAFLRRAGLK